MKDAVKLIWIYFQNKLTLSKIDWRNAFLQAVFDFIEKDKEIGKYTPQVDEDNPDSDKVES